MRRVTAVVSQSDKMELVEVICKEEHVRLQVELQVLLERGAVEVLPHIEWAGIVSLTARVIVEVREDRISGWQGRVTLLLQCCELLVGVYALADQQVEVLLSCRIELQGCPKLLEGPSLT